MRIVALIALLGCSSESHAVPAPSSTVVADSGAPVAKDTSPADVADALDCTAGKTCVGSPLPSWTAFDFQPKSAGYSTSYGLSAFKGKVIVVALLSAS